MSTAVALAAPRIFDGAAWHCNVALVIRDGLVKAIATPGTIPGDATLIEAQAGLLVPGFVDLQVNGGGGVMLNDRQDVAAIRTICKAHARFGTTALLPTLITDTPEVTARAAAAGAMAAREEVPGFLGLHLEGPHLSIMRKGAHDPALIRPMTQEDQDNLVAARAALPVLLTTVAPESVSREQISALAAAGIVVSIGHSDAGRESVRLCIEAGATMVTHLFNAMSQLGNREPGLVGAALDAGTVFAGLIADGFHVDPVSIGIALRGKRGPGRVFLVTDAMATIGTDVTQFMLNGRIIHRRGGRLTLADGTLAGADLDMISAVRFIHRVVGVELDEALRMASLYPAMAMGLDAAHGRLVPGARADVVHLTDELDIASVRIGGQTVFSAH